LNDFLDQLDHRNMTVGRRAKIPRAGILLRLIPQSPRQPKISGERFQDVLPGTDGLWMTNNNRLVGHEGANAIRNEAILGPIAAPADIAPPHREQANRGVEQTLLYTDVSGREEY